MAIVAAVVAVVLGWKFGLPWGVAAIAGGLLVASFTAGMRAHRGLDALLDAQKSVEKRATRLRGHDDLTDESFYLWELIEPEAKAVVMHRTFTRCTIRGPGVLCFPPQAPLKFRNNRVSVESWFIPLDGNGWVFGVVGFFGCRFERCTFGPDLGFVGASVILDQIKTSPRV
jgi:hypothetical protein